MRRSDLWIMARTMENSRTSLELTSPYEAPKNPEIHLQTVDQSADKLADVVIRILGERKIVEGPAA